MEKFLQIRRVSIFFQPITLSNISKIFYQTYLRVSAIIWIDEVVCVIDRTMSKPVWYMLW